MAAVGPKGTLILSAVFYLLCTVQAAPVDEGGPSQALQLSESIADARGCYYNFEHYGEGDRILTNEPCLNCTCHNRMLMCYLRVCPFTKAIGQDCTVEKKPDQCCPIITCPQVHVALLTSSTTETPPTTTALGRPDSYGCILEDDTFYADGAQVPSHPQKPCELCYCIRNHTACVMQECTLNVEGCKPVYQEGICCPVRYDCDYDDLALTPKPTIGLVTTPGGPSSCPHNGRIYHDGAMVMKDMKLPCEHCYCMNGTIVCVVQECGTPLEGTDCIPMQPKHGQCCPNYKCANGTNSIGNGEFSTETLPQSSTTESYGHIKHGSDEDSSNESSSNESSEESQEESGSGISKPIDDEHGSITHTQETSPTYAPNEPSVSDPVYSAHEQYTKQPETIETVTAEVPLQDNNLQQAGDSISEATQEQDITHVHEAITDHKNNQDKEAINEQEIVQEPTQKTEVETTEKQNVNLDQGVILEQGPSSVEEAGSKPEEKPVAEQEVTHVQKAPSDQEATTHVQEASAEPQSVPEQESQTKTPSAVVKDSDVTNEIPESTPSEHSEVTTEEPASEAARVPGEGSCLIEGKTYAHNTIIPNANPCQESCRCYSSIVSCKPKDCPPAPTQFEHCMPITTPGSCCPTYMCDQKPSDAPEVQNQLADKIDDPSPVEQEDEHVGATQETAENEHKNLANGPIVEGIPPDNLVPGSHEDEVPEAQPQGVPEVSTGAYTDIPSSNINEDDNVNSDAAHGLDVAIHEGQLDPTENKDETANRPSPPESTTAVEPAISNDNEQEIATHQEPESSSVSTTDNEAVQVEEVTKKQESDTVLPLDDELPQTPFHTTNRPNQEKPVQPQETGNAGSENVETNYPHIPAINFEPEVTTFYQDLQENQEFNTPKTVDLQPEENSDSVIDESKHIENLAPSKPVEESTHPEAEGEVATESSQYTTLQHTTEISGSVSLDNNESQINNDSEQTQTNQEQTTLSQQNVYSENVPEVSSETSISSDNGESNHLANGISDETPNVGSEGSAPSGETSSPQEDAVTTADHISLVNEESKVPASLSPEINDETPTPSSEEVSNAISSNEKSTEPSTSQALGEENDNNRDDLETVQTTVKDETVTLASEKSQAESVTQELNNAVSSSTETATSADGTTLLPLKNEDDKTEETIVETTTFHAVASTEQTSEKAVHSEVGHDDSSVSSSEPHFEEDSIPEISGQEVLTGQTAPGSGIETSTEVKSDESASQAPLEVTASTSTQDDNENNLHKDSSPEVIFEVVTNSGMPSIESHVTEGTLDHSIHHINNLADKDTLHTTENSQPLKTPVIEVESSYHPPNPEISIQLTPTTNPPATEHSTDQTTANSQKIPSVEDAHNEVISTHHETSTEELSSDVAPTTQAPNLEGFSHQVNEEENSQNTNEGSHETPETPLQTTVPPEIVKENDNSQASSEQVSSDSITEANEKVYSTQNEIQSPLSGDEKNEIAPPEVQPTDGSTEEPQHISTGDEVTTESVNEVSDKTTAIPLTEAVQNEPGLEDNSEADSINHPQTDTPSLEENLGVVSVEQKPETEDGPHLPQEHTTTIIDEELSTPAYITEDMAATNSPVEISQSTFHYEIAQEPITETHHTQQENVPEDKISGVQTPDMSKQPATEVASDEVAVPSSSESPELPLSDNKETTSEVTTENLLEAKPGQSSTPLVSTIDEESSTSYVEAISQTHNTESSSINIPEENPVSPNNSEDSQAAQVTHVENVVPPAPDSESHILDTSATDEETSTKATEETTLKSQAALDNHQDETIQPEQPHPNEIKTDQTEQVKPDETPTNEVEMEQPQHEENPSNQVETDLSHTPDVPETDQLHPNEIPTNQIVTEQAHLDGVPSKPVESEQPHTDETEATTNQVEPEQSLPSEVPTNQVEIGQSLADEIKTDQAETEPAYSDEIEPHTTNEIPTNQAEVGQSHNEGTPTNQVESEQPHTAEIPSDPIGDEVPTHQIETEGQQNGEVPIHQAQTEQPKTAEKPVDQVQTEQPLTAEVTPGQVQTEQPLTAEVPADQVQTEQPLTAEVPADQVQTEQPLTAEVPADQVQTEQSLTAEVTPGQVQTEQPLTAEVPADQIQTEQPLTAEVPADQVQTEQPLTAEVTPGQVQTEQPLTAEVPADQVQTEQPLAAEVTPGQVQTEQPLTAEVPPDQVQTEQPLTAEVPAGQIQTEQPLTAEVPAGQIQTEQPLAAEVPADQVQTEQSLPAELAAGQVQTEQPQTPEVPADQVQTEQPLPAEVPADQVQTEQPLISEVPADQVQTEKPLTAEVPAGQVQTEQPLTAEVPAGLDQTEQPLIFEVPADQVQTEQPAVELPADQVHADDTPVNQVETGLSPSEETPTDQTVEIEQPHTPEVSADQGKTEQPQTVEVPDQVQTGQSSTEHTSVNEAETGLSPSEDTDQAQPEPNSDIIHSEDAPGVSVTNVPESTEKLQEIVDHEVSSMHPDTHTNFTTQKPFMESAHQESSQSTEHSSPSYDSQTTPKEPSLVTQKIENDVGTEKPIEHKPVTDSILTIPEKSPEDLAGLNHSTDQNANGQTGHSTEMSILTEILSSTLKPSPVYHEEGPSYPTWSQKPFEHHTTPEPHQPEDSHDTNGFDPEYEDEEGVSYGPGTCRYGGKVYLSAQQIPRDDPCDFCFCFRSDIICLQQSCPPPIRGCYQETIKGFCCPRYECHVSMATMLNITTTTTTTTTTLPPHFFAHAYNGAATKAGCQVKDVAYSVGERIPSTSGPCLECRCGANGQMKCDPTVCGPQEALLRQVMDAAVSRRR